MSNAFGINTHFTDKSMNSQVQGVLEQIDNLRKEKRVINMKTVLNGRKKCEAVKWFRSVMCIFLMKYFDKKH